MKKSVFRRCWGLHISDFRTGACGLGKCGPQPDFGHALLKDRAVMDVKQNRNVLEMRAENKDHMHWMGVKKM